MHVRLTHLPAGDVTRDLLDALPNGVFTVDREGRIVLWNSVMEELTGYSRGGGRRSAVQPPAG
jgi:PAS domain-containing protein